MRIGISSYSLDRDIERGGMTLLDAIDWAAANGAECMELVPFAFRFDDPETGKIDTAFIDKVKARARDAGIPLKKSIRLILGCDEESGWEDMAYYGAHETIPDVGFSPDASFPLINTEKGMLCLELRAPEAAGGLKIKKRPTRKK